MIKVKIKDNLGIFKQKTFEFAEGLNVLVGENGSGKTTLCNELTQYLTINKIKFIKYDAYSDGGSYSKISAVVSGHYDFASAIWSASEGETQIANISQFIPKIRKAIAMIDDYDKLFIIMDGVDSGVSIDKLSEIRELFDIINEDIIEMNMTKNIHKEVYIVVTSNSFELCQNARCICVKNSSVKRFGTYMSYKNFIVKSSQACNEK